MSTGAVPAWTPHRVRFNRVLVPALPAAACLLGVVVLAMDAHGLLAAGTGMALAMMAPLSLPMLRAVGQGSLWWLVPRTLTAALVSYLGVWVLAGIALHAPVHLLLHDGWLTSRVAVAVPALALSSACAVRLWQRSHWRSVAACGFRRPVRRAHALTDAGVWGAGYAARCVRVCALPMLLGALGHGWLTLLVLTVLLSVERLVVVPPRRTLAAGYVGLGILVALGWTL